MLERVSITRCPTTSSDEEVIQKTQEAVGLLGVLDPALKTARKIAIKINAGIDRVTLTDGKQTELTEPAVLEGVIRAIRHVSNAEIVVGDAPTHCDAPVLYERLGYPERLRNYEGVRLLDFGDGELVDVPVPGDVPLFRHYRLNRELAEADAFVSVAKMKAHKSLGCTLCIKNLFGWTPPSVYGSPRHYLHDRLIRLARVQADLAMLFKPCLNVVDGIVASNKCEWRGPAIRPEVIIAGTNVVATDHVGARVMGFDPNGDYPEHPFFYRRNAIKLAAEAGAGPNRSEDIEVIGPQPEEVALQFTVEPYDEDTLRNDQLSLGLDCVKHYLEKQDSLADRYNGRFLALLDGDVLWDGPDIHTVMRLERESGRDWRSVPQFVVQCVPRHREIERFDLYARDILGAA